MENHMGEIICSSRQDCKMTQEEFASRLGVTPQAVSKWERGLSLPDITLAEGICRILKIDANELLGIGLKQPVTEEASLPLQREVKRNLYAEPLLLQIGTGLIPIVQMGLKTDRLALGRKKLAEETGFLMPLVRIVDIEKMPEYEAVIKIYDRVVFHKDFHTESKEFEPTECYAFLVQQLTDVCRNDYGRILNKQLVKTMLENVIEQHPGIADGVYPERISILELEQTLKEVIRKKGNIRDFIHILEITEWEIIHEQNHDLGRIAEKICE